MTVNIVILWHISVSISALVIIIIFSLYSSSLTFSNFVRKFFPASVTDIKSLSAITIDHVESVGHLALPTRLTGSSILRRYH